jgi:hypothetical protein
MARSKAQLTHAKRERERAQREKRERKQEKKQARRLAAQTSEEPEASDVRAEPGREEAP